ncbi:T9SS type A sorting domain-containing protein [Adhaeribacter aquaticus]|uniref:T9SS type A sorting domain-containing protein n=1 Tax=Adhaeribacter aquaticus TaxID=299567 RepID=UPI000684623C|nr:sialidase family protein [Adhaeribacter aquaticus]
MNIDSSVRNKISIISIILLVLFGLIFWFNLSNPISKRSYVTLEIEEAAKAIRKNRKMLKASVGTPDDPDARAKWEFKRLRNPYTDEIPVDIRQRELSFSATIPIAEVVSMNQFGRNARAFVQNWDHRGPYNIGGRTRALAIDISNENIILAGGVSGGMWRSTDNGQSWVKTTDPSVVQNVTTVAQDTRTGKRNTWYYGTGERIGGFHRSSIAYRGNGIFKSTDGGVSWKILPATAASGPATFNNVFQWINRIAVNPANTLQDEVFAATIAGIQRSTDGGATWANVLGTISNVESVYRQHSYFTEIAIGQSGVMYATMSQLSNNGGTATVRGIFRSTDGVTWTNITPANFPQVYERIVLDIAPSNENIVYFLANTPNAGKFDTSLYKYTYSSGNGAGAGGIWENRSVNIPGFGGEVGNYNHQNNYNMVVEVKPDNSNHVIIGGTNLYLSTDGFASSANTRWIGGYSRKNNVSKYANHHPDQHALAFYPSNANRYISAHDGGLSRTANILATDTVRWENLNRGYLTTQFYSIALDHSEANNTLIGGMQDNGTHITGEYDPKAEWYEYGSGDGGFAFIKPSSVFVSVYEGYVLRHEFSSQGKYVGSTRVDPKGAKGYMFINPYIIDPNNEFVMYQPAGDSLWRNTNLKAIPVSGNSNTKGTDYEPKSTNWKVISVLNASQSISAISASKSTANLLYFGTDDGKMYKITDALSGDSPARTEITGTNFPPNAYINSIAVDPANGENVIVAFSNYGVMSLFRTTNGGSSWTAIGGNLEEKPDGGGNGPSVRWINILPPAVPGGQYKYFVGTSTGLYATSNFSGNTTTWIKEGAATIGSVPVDMVDSRSVDNMVAVGTYGNGAYSYRHTEPLAVPEEVEVPKTFTVKQNYPNPFSASTTITYSLVKSGKVSVKIFDLTGREIATLINAQQEAGTHEVTWNGRNGSALADGIYIYNVQVGSQQITKQMLLLRR